MTPEMIEIPCITMYDPWAYWVYLGWKDIETRTHQRFKCLNGKRIGIHVSQHWDKSAIELARPYMTMEQREKTSTLYRWWAGHIICTAQAAYIGELSFFDSKSALIDCEKVVRFGLRLSNIQQLPTCPETKFAGKQGIWKASLPEHIFTPFPSERGTR